MLKGKAATRASRASFARMKALLQTREDGSEQAFSRVAKSLGASGESAEVQVDIFGELVAAVVAADVLYDVANERVRG